MGNLEDMHVNGEPRDEQITRETFLIRCHLYLAWAKRDSLEAVFHVYTHATDTWEDDPNGAYDIFQTLIAETQTGRLSVELYQDRENDVMVHEACLLAV